ncbi:hypothetical protein BP5796_11868 [Coleophoma crateriformis]|uniref:Uncharacterized protein n=1 Tax=Coleophoma crateriformis TaxID=565419 RepID=A0A3D8QEI9_9HELO|nr:hypothetical protein BP5796_11868 [Coleophoma crateriformis]
MVVVLVAAAVAAVGHKAYKKHADKKDAAKKHAAKKADEKLAAAAAKEGSGDDSDSSSGGQDAKIYEIAGDSEFVLPPPPYAPDDIGSPQRVSLGTAATHLSDLPSLQNTELSLSTPEAHPVVAELEGNNTMLRPEPLFTARSPVSGESETEMIPPIPQKSARRISTEL